MALAYVEDSQMNTFLERRTTVVEPQDKFDLSTWEIELKAIYDRNDYKGVIGFIRRFIESIITHVSNKSYHQQILISRNCFSLLKDIVKEEWRYVFVKDITQFIFDKIIEEHVKCWCIKKELLKIFNIWIQQTESVTRLESVKCLSKMYLFKMVDNISCYGDYDLQITIIETIFRMYGRLQICAKLKELIPESETLSQTFAEINPGTFDEDCRIFLNTINQKYEKIFSIVCENVIIENSVCLPPVDDLGGLWVDFNICDQAISWYRKIIHSTDDGSQIEQWELITLFTSELESANADRKPDAVFIHLHFKSDGQLISSSEQDEQFLNQAKSVLMILKRNEESEKLLTDVLPKILGELCQPSSKPQKKCSTAKINYKSLNIKVNKMDKSLISEVSSTYNALNPLSKHNISSAGSRSAGSNKNGSTNPVSSESVLEILTISSTTDPNENLPDEGNNSSNENSQKNCDSIEKYATPEQNTETLWKVSKHQGTNSSSDQWKTAEAGTSEYFKISKESNLNEQMLNPELTEDFDSLKVLIAGEGTSKNSKTNILKSSNKPNLYKELLNPELTEDFDSPKVKTVNEGTSENTKVSKPLPVHTNKEVVTSPNEPYLNMLNLELTDFDSLRMKTAEANISENVKVSTSLPVNLFKNVLKSSNKPNLNKELLNPELTEEIDSLKLKTVGEGTSENIIKVSKCITLSSEKELLNLEQTKDFDTPKVSISQYYSTGKENITKVSTNLNKELLNLEQSSKVSISQYCSTGKENITKVSTNLNKELLNPELTEEIDSLKLKTVGEGTSENIIKVSKCITHSSEKELLNLEQTKDFYSPKVSISQYYSTGKENITKVSTNLNKELLNPELTEEIDSLKLKTVGEGTSENIIKVSKCITHSSEKELLNLEQTKDFYSPKVSISQYYSTGKENITKVSTNLNKELLNLEQSPKVSISQYCSSEKESISKVSTNLNKELLNPELTEDFDSLKLKTVGEGTAENIIKVSKCITLSSEKELLNLEQTKDFDSPKVSISQYYSTGKENITKVSTNLNKELLNLEQSSKVSISQYCSSEKESISKVSTNLNKELLNPELTEDFDSLKLKTVGEGTAENIIKVSKCITLSSEKELLNLEQTKDFDSPKVSISQYYSTGKENITKVSTNLNKELLNLEQSSKVSISQYCSSEKENITKVSTNLNKELLNPELTEEIDSLKLKTVGGGTSENIKVSKCITLSSEKELLNLEQTKDFDSPKVSISQYYSTGKENITKVSTNLNKELLNLEQSSKVSISQYCSSEKENITKVSTNLNKELLNPELTEDLDSLKLKTVGEGTSENIKVRKCTTVSLTKKELLNLELTKDFDSPKASISQYYSTEKENITKVSTMKSARSKMRTEDVQVDYLSLKVCTGNKATEENEEKLISSLDHSMDFAEQIIYSNEAINIVDEKTTSNYFPQANNQPNREGAKKKTKIIQKEVVHLPESPENILSEEFDEVVRDEMLENDIINALYGLGEVHEVENVKNQEQKLESSKPASEETYIKQKNPIEEHHSINEEEFGLSSDNLDIKQKVSKMKCFSKVTAKEKKTNKNEPSEVDNVEEPQKLDSLKELSISLEEISIKQEKPIEERQSIHEEDFELSSDNLDTKQKVSKVKCFSKVTAKEKKTNKNEPSEAENVEEQNFSKRASKETDIKQKKPYEEHERINKEEFELSSEKIDTKQKVSKMKCFSAKEKKTNKNVPSKVENVEQQKMDLLKELSKSTSEETSIKQKKPIVEHQSINEEEFEVSSDNLDIKQKVSKMKCFSKVTATEKKTNKNEPSEVDNVEEQQKLDSLKILSKPTSEETSIKQKKPIKEHKIINEEEFGLSSEKIDTKFGDKVYQIRDQNGSLIGEINNHTDPTNNRKPEATIGKPSKPRDHEASAEKRKMIQFDVTSLTNCSNKTRDLNQTVSTTFSGRKRRKLFNLDDMSVINREEIVVEMTNVEKVIPDEVDKKSDTFVFTKRSSQTIENASKRSQEISKERTERLSDEPKITSAIEVEKIYDKNASKDTKNKINKRHKERKDKKSAKEKVKTNTTKRTNLGNNRKNFTSMEEVLDAIKQNEKKHRRYVKLNATISSNSTTSKFKLEFEKKLDSWRQVAAKDNNLKKYLDNKNRKGISERNTAISGVMWNKKKSCSKTPKLVKKPIRKKNKSFDISDLEKDDLIPIKSKKHVPVTSTPILDKSINDTNKRKIVILSDIPLDPWNMDPVMKRPRIQEVEDESNVPISQKNNIKEPELDHITESEVHEQESGRHVEYLLLQSAPSWTATAFFNDETVTIKSNDFIGKYLVLFFYPLDFAFMPYAEPPSEILSINENYEKFLQLNTEVIGCSVDFPVTHHAWLNMQNESRHLKFPIIADFDHKISQDFMIYSDRLCHSYRGFYIIDPDGIIIAISICDIKFRIPIDEIFSRIRNHQLT